MDKRLGLVRRPATFRRSRRLRAEDLDAEPVGIEDEERVVVVEVAILLGRVVDARAQLAAPLERFVDLLPAFDLEGEVLDPYVVVGVLAAVRRAKAKVLLAKAR
jgi:hypothetical protein